MGVTYCKKHGKQSILEICVHIFESIQTKNALEIIDIPSINMKVCKNCIQGIEIGNYKDFTILDFLSLKGKQAEIIDEKLFLFYDSINRRTICLKCFKEFFS